MYSNKNNSYYGFYVNGSVLRKPLENYFSEQLYGADVTGYVPGETEIGFTSYYSDRAAKGPDPWRYPPQENGLMVYGAHAATYLGRFNFCGEIGKVRDHGKALFLETGTTLANLGFSVSYRKYDLDYYNPHAGSYSRHYPQSVFRCRDEKGVLVKVRWQVLSVFGVSTFFDQYAHEAQTYWSKSKGDYAISLGKKEIDREMGLETKTLVGTKLVLNADARYKDNNIYKDSGSEKVNFTAKACFAPNEILETSLKYYARKYLYLTADYVPFDYIVAGCSFRINRSCEIESSLKYANLFVYQSRSGIAEYGGKLHFRVNEDTKINLSYSVMPPLAANSKYEFEDEADLLPYADEYYLDKFLAEVVFHW